MEFDESAVVISRDRNDGWYEAYNMFFLKPGRAVHFLRVVPLCFGERILAVCRITDLLAYGTISPANMDFLMIRDTNLWNIPGLLRTICSRANADDKMEEFIGAAVTIDGRPTDFGRVGDHRASTLH